MYCLVIMMLKGFLNSHNVLTSKLEKRKTNKGDFYFLKKHEKGKKINVLNIDKILLTKVLKEGTIKASYLAEKNLKNIKEIVGFI